METSVNDEDDIAVPFIAGFSATESEIYHDICERGKEKSVLLLSAKNINTIGLFCNNKRKEKIVF
jgi:hypothetical protein